MEQFDGGFTSSFAANLERMEREGQLETLALIFGFVGVVRVAAEFGRRCAEFVYQHVTIGAHVQVNQDEIFALMD